MPMNIQNTQPKNMVQRVILSLRDRAKAVADAMTLVDPPLYR
jgi:hypothetical protein